METRYKVMVKGGEYYGRQRYEGINGRGYTNDYDLRSAFAVVMRAEKQTSEMLKDGSLPRDLSHLNTYQIRTKDTNKVVYQTNWVHIMPVAFFDWDVELSKR